jgi:hypothetical protein
MTETTPLPDPPQQVATTSASGILISFLATLLAPMFLGVTAGDVALARAAAIEAINAYQARNHADLIAVAQIIACGLAALGSLSLSMADDISLTMALRLLGNANALNRSAEHNRRALQGTRPNDPAPEITFKPADDDQESRVLAELAQTQNRVAEANIRLQSNQPAAPPAPACPRPVQTPNERRNQAAWAHAMTDVAGEFTASIANLPPTARKEASRRAALLNGCANDLLSGNVPPRLRPGDLAAFVRSRMG